MSYNPYSLEGKTILITGASSGIGQATAIECSKLGAKVVIIGRNEERLQYTMSQLDGEGHKYIVCDLSDSEELNRIISEMPSLDGLVNNAGIGNMSPISFIKEKDLETVFRTNTFAPILLLKLLSKKKLLAKNSSVVFTSSVAGLGAASTGNGIYSASKGALSAFIKVAALEFATKNIRVNAVCPGMTRTPLIENESVQEEELIKDMERYPLKRYAEPKEIAWGIIYLLSDASSFVTGDNLVIDGGLNVY